MTGPIVLLNCKLDRTLKSKLLKIETTREPAALQLYWLTALDSKDMQQTTYIVHIKIQNTRSVY